MDRSYVFNIIFVALIAALIFYLPNFGYDARAINYYIENGQSISQYGYTPFSLLMLLSEYMTKHFLYLLNVIIFVLALTRFYNKVTGKSTLVLLLLYYTSPVGFLFLIDTPKQMLGTSIFIFSLTISNKFGRILSLAMSIVTHRVFAIFAVSQIAAIRSLWLLAVIAYLCLLYSVTQIELLKILLGTYASHDGDATGRMRAVVLGVLTISFVIVRPIGWRKYFMFTFVFLTMGIFLHPVFFRVLSTCMIFYPLLFLRFSQSSQLALFSIIVQSSVLPYTLLIKDYT